MIAWIRIGRSEKGTPAICLIAFAHRQHPDYPLIVLANRDEFHARPASPLHWWEDRPLLAGRDLQAGGTWLAVDRGGRVAAVTNYREWPRTPGARSRGELPLLALACGNPWSELPGLLEAEGPAFGGFNLLVADRSRALTLSNREPRAKRPEPGIHAVSNGSLDASWAKVRRSRAALAGALDAGATEPEALAALLWDETPAADQELPETGLDAATERFLSPCFIRGEDYGTRASTVIRVGHRHADVLEFRFGPGGAKLGRTEHAFALAPGACRDAH